MDPGGFLLSSEFLSIWFSPLCFHLLGVHGTSSPKQRGSFLGRGDNAAPAEVYGKPRQAPRWGFESPFWGFFITCYTGRKHLLLQNKDESPKVTEISSIGATGVF